MSCSVPFPALSLSLRFLTLVNYEKVPIQLCASKIQQPIIVTAHVSPINIWKVFWIFKFFWSEAVLQLRGTVQWRPLVFFHNSKPALSQQKFYLGLLTMPDLSYNQYCTTVRSTVFKERNSGFITKNLNKQKTTQRCPRQSWVTKTCVKLENRSLREF